MLATHAPLQLKYFWRTPHLFNAVSLFNIHDCPLDLQTELHD
eukprot:Gb_09264 [translate_table: standard]